MRLYESVKVLLYLTGFKFKIYDSSQGTPLLPRGVPSVQVLVFYRVILRAVLVDETNLSKRSGSQPRIGQDLGNWLRFSFSL